MKRVLLVGLMLLMAAPVLARNGAISLFTGSAGSFDCDMLLGAFQTGTIHIYWIKGEGPDLGNTAEFKLQKTSAQLTVLAPTWDARFTTVIGTLEGGISVGSNDCVGVGETYVHIGQFNLMNLGEPDTAWLKVMPDPNALEPGYVYITLCDLQKTTYAVEGGWFLIDSSASEPNPTCSTAVIPRSWGAIKSLYRAE